MTGYYARLAGSEAPAEGQERHGSEAPAEEQENCGGGGSEGGRKRHRSAGLTESLERHGSAGLTESPERHGSVALAESPERYAGGDGAEVLQGCFPVTERKLREEYSMPAAFDAYRILPRREEQSGKMQP